MNNIHKVIFNKSTQQFVVVSELTKSAGKIKAISVVSVSYVPFLQNFSKKQPLVISHQSDLKIGEFSRVSSPLIDLIQTVEQAVNNKNASDRIKAAQAMGAAAKAYSTAADLANGGALFRVETGTGFSHSRNKNQTASQESVGNQVNAQHIAITSRSGDINATHTAFTSKDEQGNRLKDSSVTFDSARDINFSAGQSEYQQQGKQQSSGFEAGTGVAVGAQTGWYFYAQAGFSNGKQDERHLTHHNTQIDSETINIRSQGDTNLKGATAKANRINAEIQGKLTIESLRDEHRSNSSSAGVGGRVQAAIGTAWGASGYGNLASGKSNSKQVVEQSGLFAEEGGYNVSANEVSLIGGAIASSNPANSTLITNNITFSDIQNESSSQAITAGISGSANLNNIAGTQAKTDEQAKQQAEMAKLTGTVQSNGINPGLPMFEQSRDNSTTKATLTEGMIILHKDTNPTQTTAAALGINTDLSQANRQVEQPKDINQALKEQQILSQAAGNVAGAVMTYADNQKAELDKAKEKAREDAIAAEQAGDLTTAERKQHEAQMLEREAARWESGGDNKRKATVVATALSLAVAGKPAEAIAAGAASPYINEAIKHITENTDNKVLEALNVPLHILWGAVEAELAGGSAKAGAVAAGVGEIGARVLAESVYGKQPNELNEEEKQNLLTTSKALAGIAIAGISGGTGAETLANASVGMTVAENALENNYLLVDYSQLKGLTKTDTEQGQKINEKLEKAGVENIDDYAAQYRACGDNSTCQKQVIDAEMEAISRSYDIINELAKSGELSKNDIDFIQSTLVPRARGAYDSKAKNETTRAVYHSGDLETFAKSEHRLAEARFSAQLKSWVDQGLTDEQIRHKLENEPLAIALSTAGPNVGGRQPSGSGMGVPTFANARQTLLQIRALSKQASDFSVEVPSTVSAKDRQVTVTETVGYGKGTTNLRVSTGAENVALYPKLKDDLRSQQQAGFEKVIKDLNVKPQGSVLMLPDYRQKLAEAKSSLPPNLQGRGNSAIASVNIDGLDTKFLAGHSQIDRPQGAFIGSGNTKFNSLELPNKKGIPIDRKTDSEYKIFSNLADQLGSNTQAKGQVTIFTERPACPSCLGVAEQFNRRYPNIKVNIFDNNGNLIKP